MFSVTVETTADFNPVCSDSCFVQIKTSVFITSCVLLNQDLRVLPPPLISGLRTLIGYLSQLVCFMFVVLGLRTLLSG